MKKKQRIQLQQEARKTKNQVATSKTLQKKNRFRQEVFAYPKRHLACSVALAHQETGLRGRARL